MSNQEGLSEYTGYLIRRAQQAHVAVWQRVASAEITSVQYGVLRTLQNHPGASQRQLCDALDLDRSTIADIVSRLQRRGLIERVRADDDRRRNILQLTEVGRTEVQALIPRVAEVDRILGSGLTSAEQRQLRTSLTRLLTATEIRTIMSGER